MSYPRNVEWQVTADASSKFTIEQAQLLVQMDIRDELRKLNSILSCPHFLGIPSKLTMIHTAIVALYPKTVKGRKPKKQ